MIEVELRGPLPEPEKALLLSRFGRKWLLTRDSKQLTIFCDTSDKRLGSFYNPKLPIAVQLSYDEASLTETLSLKVKSGHWRNIFRPEIELQLLPSQLQQTYDFLNAIGITSGCPRYYHRVDYRIDQNLLISLKDSGLAPDHWELERVIAHAGSAERTKRLLAKTATRLGLRTWGKQKYQRIITAIYEENPPIPFGNIDVSLVWN